MALENVERDVFLDHLWDYNLGEHLYACEPTQQGKSRFIWQLAQRTLNDYDPGDVSFLSLMPKPWDPATSEWAPRIGLKIIDRYPPPPRWPWQQKPYGHVLWPKHVRNADVKINRARLASVMRPALQAQYYRHGSITFVDDAHICAVMLGLNDQIEEHLTAAGSNQAGLWLANQKPSGSAATGSLTTFAYSAPAHLIFGHDPDKRNIQRFSEIGGVDPEIITWHVRRLRMWRINTPHGIKNVSEKLYVRKDGPFMALIGP